MKKPQNIVAKILNLYAEHRRKYKTRIGQSLMNALFELCPEKYNEITGTTADCFYDDEKIVYFWEAITKDLEEKNVH